MKSKTVGYLAVVKNNRHAQNAFPCTSLKAKNAANRSPEPGLIFSSRCARAPMSELIGTHAYGMRQPSCCIDIVLLDNNGR